MSGHSTAHHRWDHTLRASSSPLLHCTVFTADRSRSLYYTVIGHSCHWPELPLQSAFGEDMEMVSNPPDLRNLLLEPPCPPISLEPPSSVFTAVCTVELAAPALFSPAWLCFFLGSARQQPDCSAASQQFSEDSLLDVFFCITVG